MNPAAKLAGGLVAVVLVASWLPDGRSTDGQPVNVRPVDTIDAAAPGATATPSAMASPAAPSPPGSPVAGAAAPSTPEPTSAPQAPPAAVTAPLLMPASGGDGDSWRDTAGREYRLGMVNAPETDECFAAQATAERRRLVAAGFRSQVYSADRYGRQVTVVTTADGTNLNVHLARHGFVDDRYLAQFRHQNPLLARELDEAFAQARSEQAGLWRACRRQAAPQGIDATPPPDRAAAAPGASCHPDYVTCIPVKGDGSGRGQANDLDCGDLDRRVQLRRVGTDPYRLDGSDGDGYGCEQR